MARHSKKRRSQKSGLPPGTLIHIGEDRTSSVKITIIDYDENNYTEKIAKTTHECCSFKDKPSVTWINIDGIHDVGVIEQVGKDFGLHSLMLEDILNTEQRPKMEDYDNHLFIVLKMLSFDDKSGEVNAEQVALVLGKNFVISFQEGSDGDVFDNIRERIRTGKGRHRRMGADYLAYSLIDAVVDNYFVILEHFGEKIDDLGDVLVTNPKRETLQDLHALKKEMLFLRKSVWPLREVISSMQRNETQIIQPTSMIYLRDVYDHTIQVIDTVETYREMLSGMLDIYLSSISNKMNEIMKVLTIISTIFIPMTFVVGLYGMNFVFMPEIHWKYGYLFAWFVIISIAIVFLIYFKRKKWI